MKTLKELSSIVMFPLQSKLFQFTVFMLVQLTKVSCFVLSWYELVIYQASLFRSDILSHGCIAVAHNQAHDLIVAKSDIVSCLLFKSVLVASTEVSALIVILPLPHHKLIQVQATAFAQVFLSVTVQVHQLADVNL